MLHKAKSNRRFYKLFTILFFLLTGCKGEDSILTQFEQKGDKIVKTQTSKLYGNVISEQEFIKDASGEMIANGFLKSYFRNGQMKSLSFYQNGIQDSISLSYYEDGLIRKKNYFTEDGRFFGPQYYYSSKNSIDSTMFYYSNNKRWLTLRFNNTGGVKSYDGSFLHIILPGKSPYFDSIPVGIPLMLLFEPAIVEGKKTEVNFKIEQNDIVIYDTLFTAFSPILNTYMGGIKYKFKDKGKYYFQSKVTLINKDGTHLFADSVNRRIAVY